VMISLYVAMLGQLMYKCWLVGSPIPLGGRSWHVLLVPILKVLGFIAPTNYPLVVVTPIKLGIYVLGRYSSAF
jgi:hypothetical protein